MGLFKRRAPWSPADIPDLSFSGPTAYVDIGSLGGDEHRAAFAAIFARVLADNQDRLAGYDLVQIEADREVAFGIGLPAPILGLDSNRLALCLYDSGNDRVFLVLSRASGTAKLAVVFDNPEFWLDEAAA